VALGFVIGGVVMLLAHPRSQPLMNYAFKPDNAKEVLAGNPLANEPFEFFPPDAAEMDGRQRYLDAFRIVRRLRSNLVRPDEGDLAIVERFFSACEELDPDNAYWPQLQAAVHAYSGDVETAQSDWKRAIEKGRWDTGESEALHLLWAELAAADGQRLAWQGVVSLDHASEGPSHFIFQQVRKFGFDDFESRFQSLANAAMILESSRSFSTASAAIALAELAVFDRIDPIASLGQRQYEVDKTRFPASISEAVSAQAGERAIEDIQTVESWQAFYRSGAPIAQATLSRMRWESLLTASLPSSLFMASLFMVGIGLVGTITAALFGPVLNPDRRILVGLGLLVALLLWWKSGVMLLALWTLTIAGVLSIPQMTARDEPIPWRTGERVAVVSVALLGMFLLAAWFVRESTPAIHLAGRKLDGAMYGAVAALTLSLALPCAAVWARIRKVSMMRAVGETLRLLGFSGSVIGLALTVILSPIALWRDAVDRDLLEDWVRNEPATFRPDMPQ
jgi:hypothetical protein